MSNVVAIVQDPRMRRQIEQYLRELDMEGLKSAIFTTSKEFTDLYFRTNTPDASSETTEADLKLFSTVHLLIFALDSIGGEKVGPWITKVRAGLKTFKQLPENIPLRMVLLKYEDDGIAKTDVFHPAIDDLIYLPLDRLVFLQKLQILLNLPKRVKPSFLFTQDIKEEIEISKISYIDRLSDVGLAIRNPVPLKRGLAGHFYLQFPQDKTILDIYAKVLRSEPHPDLPEQYLVYFVFFGLGKAALSAIRRYLSRAPRYQSLYNEDRGKFRFNAHDLFMEEPNQPLKRVTVIDVDPTVAQMMAEQISKDMDRIESTSHSSYSIFMHQQLTGEALSAEAKGAVQATEATDLYSPDLTLTLSPEGKCLGLFPTPEAGNTFLGHEMLMLFSSPDTWLNLIADKESRLILGEAIGLALRGRIPEYILNVLDSRQVARALKFRFEKVGGEKIVNAKLSTVASHELPQKSDEDKSDARLAMLIIDANFISEDSAAWAQSFRNQAYHAQLTAEPSAPNFILLAEPDTISIEKWVESRDFSGLFLKPVDNRQLMFLLSEMLPNKNTIYNFENLGWNQPGLSMHVAKKIELEALGEYGATLKAKQPIATGTLFFLRKFIFKNAPNECLAARVYACEPHANEKDTYSIYVTYFGINDQFLKFARTWIRENYASQKNQSE